MTQPPSTTGEPDSLIRDLLQGFAHHRVLDISAEALAAPNTRWWGGPLDVETLAYGSVSLVSAALRQLDGRLSSTTTTPEHVAAAFGSINQLRIQGRAVQSFAAGSGFFRTADGWIRTHANYPHHRASLLTALQITEIDQIEQALGELNACEAEELIVRRGGVAAAVRTAGQWSASTVGASAAAGQWADFDMYDAGRGRWSPEPTPQRPLEGFRVLDFTRVIAGPTASRTLGAFGADVIHIDPPHIPELLDQHLDTGFSKRSTLLDLRSPDGLGRCEQLLAEADAVLLGYRPGALEQHGLSIHALRERYPELIIGQLCAWGFDGPWRHRRGFDSLVQAACGIADLYRHSNQTPGALPVQALDHATGYGLAASIIALAAARAQHGRVGSVRLSLARTAAALMATRKPVQQPDDVGELPRRSRESAYGSLSYAPPPFLIGAEQVDYDSAPSLYGQDCASWS